MSPTSVDLVSSQPPSAAFLLKCAGVPLFPGTMVGRLNLQTAYIFKNTHQFWLDELLHHPPIN